MTGIELIKNYPIITQMIKERREELLYPCGQEDTNSGGGSSGFVSDPVGDCAMVLTSDEWLCELNKKLCAIHVAVRRHSQLDQIVKSVEEYLDPPSRK